MVFGWQRGCRHGVASGVLLQRRWWRSFVVHFTELASFFRNCAGLIRTSPALLNRGANKSAEKSQQSPSVRRAHAHLGRWKFKANIITIINKMEKGGGRRKKRRKKKKMMYTTSSVHVYTCSFSRRTQINTTKGVQRRCRGASWIHPCCPQLFPG